jgi:hypothetical protein
VRVDVQVRPRVPRVHLFAGVRVPQRVHGQGRHALCLPRGQQDHVQRVKEIKSRQKKKRCWLIELHLFKISRCCRCRSGPGGRCPRRRRTRPRTTRPGPRRAAVSCPRRATAMRGAHPARCGSSSRETASLRRAPRAASRGSARAPRRASPPRAAAGCMREAPHSFGVVSGNQAINHKTIEQAGK